MQVIVIPSTIIIYCSFVALLLLSASSILTTLLLYRLSQSPKGEPAPKPLIRESKATKRTKTVYLTDKRENDKAKEIAEGA